MSIIQDALKKAESHSPIAVTRTNILRTDEVLALKSILKNISPKTVISSIPNRRLLAAATIAGVIAVPLFAAMFFLWKPVTIPAKDSATYPDKASTAYSQEVSYRSLTEDAEIDRDESAPMETSDATKPPRLSLNGIMYIEKGPRALINNMVVGPGEMISGATVKEINRQTVILDYKNAVITLRLK